MNRKEDILAVRMLVRAREDFQSMRIHMDDRIGMKADGTPMNLKQEHVFDIKDVEMFSSISGASRDQEDAIQKSLHTVLKRFPIYTEYLSKIDGVGDIASGWIIGNFDIEKATTVSKLWQYSGLNPGMVHGKKAINEKIYKPEMGTIVGDLPDAIDGTKRLLIVTDTMVRGDKLTEGFVSPFNTNLRTALVGIMAGGFIKSGIRWPEVTEQEYNEAPDGWKRIKDGKFQRLAIKDGSYANFYMNYKNRLANEERWKDESDGHRDHAAKRYMVKMFLKDLYVAWRTMEGLPVRVPYQEEYLNHVHVA
jgi:hypothetical protein